jgi:hypothetical protein
MGSVAKGQTLLCPKASYVLGRDMQMMRSATHCHLLLLQGTSHLWLAQQHSLPLMQVLGTALQVSKWMTCADPKREKSLHSAHGSIFNKGNADRVELGVLISLLPDV